MKISHFCLCVRNILNYSTSLISAFFANIALANGHNGIIFKLFALAYSTAANTIFFFQRLSLHF